MKEKFLFLVLVLFCGCFLGSSFGDEFSNFPKRRIERAVKVYQYQSGRYPKKSSYFLKQQTTGSISGTVYYEGELEGTIYIGAFEETYSETGLSFFATIPFPGPYTISGVLPGDYLVAAFMDVNGDGFFGENEPYGEYGIVSVGEGQDITGVDIYLYPVPPPPPAYNISCPYWYIEVNDAGYSDWMIQTYPGQESHENLSGEWAAAIYYDGIETPGHQTMWLTQWFSCPDFQTNSNFETVQSLQTWDDPDNPTEGNDTGYSIISNGKLEIKILYNMIKTETGVACGLRPGGEGDTQPIYSGPYVLEVTYEIKNITNETLNNVRFYQFLHAHPNDNYESENFGVYDPTFYNEGALPEYHYDITQYGLSIWNKPGSDITGFSSKEPPDFWGLGEFEGHGGEPETGLHINIYNNNLPNNFQIGPAQVAGAMGWLIGSLAPGQVYTKKVLLYNGYTIAGIPYKPPVIDFTGTPVEGEAPLYVYFEPKIIDGAVSEWYWDFGDGETSDERNPYHIYRNPGIYTVILTAIGPGGQDTKTKTDYIIVNPSSARIVWIPNTNGLHNSEVLIPIMINDATGVAGFQFSISFDPGVLEAIGADAGDLTSSWVISANTEIPGEIRIVGFNPNAEGLSGGSGSLCMIRFNVVGNSGWSTGLCFWESKLSDIGANEIPSNALCGAFAVTVELKKGDINGDEIIDISDVILCLRMAVGLTVEIKGQTYNPAYPDWLIEVADMNDDGVVDISDVILILRKAVGLD